MARDLGATGSGVWDSGTSICSRTSGDNSPVVADGIYIVHGIGVINGRAGYSDMQIYSGTPPVLPPPH